MTVPSVTGAEAPHTPPTNLDTSEVHTIDLDSPGDTNIKPATKREREEPPSRSEHRTATAREWVFATSTEGAGADEPTPCIVYPLSPGTYRQTSSFGARTHPINGASSHHSGTDLAAPMGTAIHAVADGHVIYAGPGMKGRSSNIIIVEHHVRGDTFWSWYVHMYNHGVHVSPGQRVSAGDKIASVGSNGNSTGPHLHFEIHTTPPTGPDTATDPLPFLDSLGHGLRAPGAC